MTIELIIPAGEVRAVASSHFTLDQVLKAIQRESMRDEPNQEVMEMLTRERDRLQREQAADK